MQKDSNSWPSRPTTSSSTLPPSKYCCRKISLVDETQFEFPKDYEFDEDLKKVADLKDAYDEVVPYLPKFEVHKNGENIGFTRIKIVTRAQSTWSTPLPRTRKGQKYTTWGTPKLEPITRPTPEPSSTSTEQLSSTTTYCCKTSSTTTTHKLPKPSSTTTSKPSSTKNTSTTKVTSKKVVDDTSSSSSLLSAQEESKEEQGKKLKSSKARLRVQTLPTPKLTKQELEKEIRKNQANSLLNSNSVEEQDSPPIRFAHRFGMQKSSPVVKEPKKEEVVTSTLQSPSKLSSKLKGPPRLIMSPFDFSGEQLPQRPQMRRMEQMVKSNSFKLKPELQEEKPNRSWSLAPNGSIVMKSWDSLNGASVDIQANVAVPSAFTAPVKSTTPVSVQKVAHKPAAIKVGDQPYRGPTYNCKVLDAAIHGQPTAYTDPACKLSYPGFSADGLCKCTYEVNGRDENGCATVHSATGQQTPPLYPAVPMALGFAPFISYYCLEGCLFCLFLMRLFAHGSFLQMSGQSKPLKEFNMSVKTGQFLNLIGYPLNTQTNAEMLKKDLLMLMPRSEGAGDSELLHNFGLFVAGCLTAFCICANFLTVFVLIRHAPLQKSISNLYILSLSFADALIGLLVMTVLLYSEFSPTSDHFFLNSAWMCKLWQVADLLLCTVSLYSICAIAFDRVWNLEKPLRVFKRSRTLAKRLILCIWVLPSLIWISVHFLLSEISSEWQLARYLPAVLVPPAASSAHSSNECFPSRQATSLLPLIALPILYAPALTLIAMFVRISLVVHRHLKFLKEHSNLAQQQVTSPSQERSQAADRSMRNSDSNMHLKTPDTNCRKQTFDSLSTVTSGYYTTTALRMGALTPLSEEKSKASSNSERVVVNHSHLFAAPVTLPEATSLTVEDAVINSPEARRAAYKTRLSSSESTATMCTTTAGVPAVKLFRKMSATISRQGSSRFSVIAIPGNLAELLQREGVTQQMKAAKAVGMITICFLICWFPFLILWPIKVYCSDCVPDRVYRLSIWLNYTCSSINPVLYTLSSPRVQKAIKSYIHVALSGFSFKMIRVETIHHKVNNNNNNNNHMI
uniref:G-protein coupled receptors family 1 profile domain-containing protein n=1 Tax=Ditylenchus dipsaci TaxID=166011 RepID=A0A915EER8_9BILA